MQNLLHYHGDIIDAICDDRSAVILSFGHVDFDRTSAKWSKARRKLSSLRLVGNPFLEVRSTPLLLVESEYHVVWGMFEPVSPDLHGLDALIERAAQLADEHGIAQLITNYRWFTGEPPKQRTSPGGARIVSTAISDAFTISSRRSSME